MMEEKKKLSEEEAVYYCDSCHEYVIYAVE